MILVIITKILMVVRLKIKTPLMVRLILGFVILKKVGTIVKVEMLRFDKSQQALMMNGWICSHIILMFAIFDWTYIQKRIRGFQKQHQIVKVLPIV